MARLFVALSIPTKIITELVKLQPKESGVRWVKPEQIHLTIQFIGEADIAYTKTLLGSIRAEKFTLNFDKLGCFPTARKPRILWLGVDICDQLVYLHNTVQFKLNQGGICVSGDRFHPHVTLARCNKVCHKSIVTKFLQQTIAAIESFQVNAFGLYSSQLDSSGSKYQLEHEILLFDRA